jgi:hypothetical protein
MLLSKHDLDLPPWIDGDDVLAEARRVGPLLTNDMGVRYHAQGVTVEPVCFPRIRP